MGLIAVGLDVPLADLFTVYERSDEMPYEKTMLIEHIARMLRLHGLPEIRAVRAILAEVFMIQRLGRK